MSLQQLKRTVTRHLANLPGWRTNRKIVVIESDDWGSIRMRSRDVYDTLLRKGVPVDRDPYCRYDSLASEEDLSALFDVLSKYKDSHGNHPVITANCIVANPDFDQIRASGFREYVYEPFTTTLERYPRHSRSFELWLEGMERGLFRPQFHGREHLRVSKWLSELGKGANYLMQAFDHEVFGVETDVALSRRKNLMAALDYDSVAEREAVTHILKDGLRLFENIFGYRPHTFIAPCYAWDGKAEEALREQGVIGIQGIPYQRIPDVNGGAATLKYHYLGQRNAQGQCYLIRNAFLEPTLEPGSNSVAECVSRISASFRMKKPAIIGSHRINYIGFLHEKNRTQALEYLSELIKKILTKWPEVEFVSSDQLVSYITQK